jgi:hypothetical protein
VRRSVIVAGLVAAATTLAAPSYAAPPQHLTFSYDEAPVLTHLDGIGTGCPAFSGTLEEDRHLDVIGTMSNDGTGHARTEVTATVVLTPDAPGSTSYAGGYTQRQSGFFVDDGHGDRVVTTTTHGLLTGSDGSVWRISEVAHLSVDAQGTVHAWFDRMRCEH